MATLMILGAGEGGLAIGADGNWIGTPGTEQAIVYQLVADDGRQLTLSPEEFTKHYGWKNDPSKVRLGVASEDRTAKVEEQQKQKPPE